MKGIDLLLIVIHACIQNFRTEASFLLDSGRKAYKKEKSKLDHGNNGHFSGNTFTENNARANYSFPVSLYLNNHPAKCLYCLACLLWYVCWTVPVKPAKLNSKRSENHKITKFHSTFQVNWLRWTNIRFKRNQKSSEA